MRSVSLSFLCSSPESLSWLDDLSLSLARLSGFDQPPLEFIKFVCRFVGTAAAVDLKLISAGPARQHRISFQPSQALLALMSAVRAVDRHENAIGQARHSSVSIGSFAILDGSDTGGAHKPPCSSGVSHSPSIGASLVSVTGAKGAGVPVISSMANPSTARAFVSAPASTAPVIAPSGATVTVQA